MSSDLAGLLEAVRERPDDDLPRLALADWCMEQPDPVLAARGEFIQLRCQAAGLPLGDEQRSVMEHRARQLRQQHERAWLGELASRVSSWDFERGLVVIELGESFPQRVPLKRLAERTEWLWVIGVKGVMLSERDLRRLTNWSLAGQLASLDLTDCEVGPGGAEVVARARRLERLTCLRLGYARVGDEGAAALAGSPRLGRLTVLSLPACGIGAAGTKALAGSKYLVRLATLDLSRNLLGLPGARSLAAGRGLPGLSVLALNGCQLGNRGAMALVHAPALDRLQVLELADNDFDQETGAALVERFGGRVRL
jgi:uncharacterized protein (TIGR02996 family)